MSIIRSFAKQLIFISILISFNGCREKNENLFQPIVEVRYIDGRAQLYRHGEPYYILGAAGTQFLDKVAKYGGNSIRTWSTHDADRILDEASKYGLTVTLGLEIGIPYWGKDFNYWNLWAVNEKIDELRPIIEKYKDHPALLMWGIGNEVELQRGGKRFLIYYIINKVAKMVKDVDPNHPTMTAVPVPPLNNKIGSFKHILTHVDILGYNAFNTLPTMYEKIYGPKGWGKAYMLSEWGPSGHWEITDTEWGAPKELKSSEKRKMMEEYWEILTKDSILFLGSYAFYWGHKHEITNTWFSFFSENGNEFESVNYLRYAWSGENIENWAPDLQDMYIETPKGIEKDNVYLLSEHQYSAKAFGIDPENDMINYKWEIRPEEVNFYEIHKYNYNMEHLFTNNNSSNIEFIAPKEEGAYRIFVFVYDDQGNVASHNIPFYVIMR